MAFTQQFFFHTSGKPFISVTGGYAGVDQNQYGNCMALDKNDRLYVPGFFRHTYRSTSPFYPNSGWLGQYSELGNLNWQRSIGGSDASDYYADNELLNDVAISPDGDYVYTVGTNTNSGWNNNVLIIKYDKDGNIQWKKEWGQSGTLENCWTCATDSNGNLFVGGGIQFISQSTYFAFMLRIMNTGGSSGVPGTSTVIYPHTYGQEITTYRDIVVDDNDNLYACGSGGNPSDAFIVKYNASPNNVIQWQKNISRGSTYYEAIESLAVDTSGNVYGVGYSNPNSGGDGVLLKFNSSGALQWSKYIGNTGERSTYGVACDRQDNVYVIGNDKTNQSPYRDVLIVKVNSSGTVQWKRSLGAINRYCNGYSIDIDSQDNVVISGTVYFSPGTGGYTYQNILTARLLSDGSGTGTYSLNGATFVYQPTTAGFGNISSPAFSVTNANNSYSGLSAGSGGYGLRTSSQSDGTWDLSSTFIVP